MENEILNVVNFIEKNPLTRLSNTYNNKFVQKIKNTFTESEQRIFVSSFYCYLNYNSQKDFIIDFDSVWKWLGFSRKDHCKVVLQKYFIKNIDYKINVEINENKAPEVAGASKVRGCAGSNKEKILLTTNTFKKLCLKSNTKKADDIHNYFVKLEEIFQEMISEESNELKNQLQLLEIKNEEQKLIIENKESEYQQKSKLDKHQFLIDKFKSKKCIYLAEIDHDKIKIGSTNDISVRKNNLKDVFGKCLFTDFFECKYYREVEQNILVSVRDYLYREKIKDHLSKEVVQLSDRFNYNQLVKIVKDEIDSYNKYMFWKDSPNSINKDNYSEIIDLLKENNIILKTIQNNLQNNNSNNITETVNNTLQIPQINIELSEPISSGQGTRGRKIQEIDSDNLNVIKKIYPSMIHVLRENSNYEKQCIQKAIKNNLIYKGSRWLFVEHNQNPNIVNNIKETVTSNQPENNYILKINLDQTEILECFYGITEMRTKYKIGTQKINSIIENKTIFDNAYFMKITECPKDLLKNYKLPTKWSKKAKSIKSINIHDNQITIYKSITEVCIKTGIGYKKLENIIKDKKVVNQCKWEYITD